jgi:hypothetical protein
MCYKNIKRVYHKKALLDVKDKKRYNKRGKIGKIYEVVF